MENNLLKSYTIKSTDKTTSFKNILTMDEIGNVEQLNFNDLPFNITTSGNITGDTVTGLSDSKIGGIWLTKESWKNKPSVDPNTSEICNNTTTEKALMIVGNNSGGGGIRRVKLWDEVTVNGNLIVTGNTSLKGDLITIANNLFDLSSTPKKFLDKYPNKSIIYTSIYYGKVLKTHIVWGNWSVSRVYQTLEDYGTLTQRRTAKNDTEWNPWEKNVISGIKVGNWFIDTSSNDLKFLYNNEEIYKISSSSSIWTLEANGNISDKYVKKGDQTNITTNSSGYLQTGYGFIF